MSSPPASSEPAGATPAMRQYFDAKRQYPDALVFFRMGDFYEMFYEDVLTASRVLELTLTSRAKDAHGTAIPMCGLPYHALDGYLSRLEESLTQAEVSYLSSTGKEKAEPPKKTHSVKPGYPEDARLASREGKVITEIVVNEEGLVSDMRLLRGAEADFVRSAFAAVPLWRYEPAQLDGRPVAVYMTVIVEWDFR